MKTISYPKVCISCNGSGIISEPFPTTTSITRMCPACNGAGTMIVTEQISQFSKEVTDEEIDAWAFQGHPPVDKFDRGYAIGKKHGAIAMREGLINQ